MADDAAIAQAKEQKDLGNAKYKAKEFDEAILHYSKAWELHKEVTFLTNLAAAYLEQGKYDECIRECERAVEEGRDMRADYKLIAKAFGRIGTAYQKKDDLDQAIKFYNKSLTEHRTPDILAKLKEAEKAKATKERLAYIDPAKAEEERNAGNALFKTGDFAGSVKSYTEAIKRDPESAVAAKSYSNRAAAFTKLMSFPEALKDAEEAIRLDPTFPKGYIRKAVAQFSLKEPQKALDTIMQAREVDKDNKNKTEIDGLYNKCMTALYQQRSTETEEETMRRIQNDPEIAQILQDPVMQSILQQAQQDPAALQSHLQNPMIRQKIQKLVQAGVIKMGSR